MAHRHHKKVSGAKIWHDFAKGTRPIGKLFKEAIHSPGDLIAKSGKALEGVSGKLEYPLIVFGGVAAIGLIYFISQKK